MTAITLTNAGTAYTAIPTITITPAAGDTTGTGAKASFVTQLVPNLPDLSMTMEAFQDTPLVNGTLYPYMNVNPQGYRFRILNAADDRTWNLQLYVASTIVNSITVTGGGSGYTSAPMVTITPAAGDTTGMGATATATIDPLTGAVTAINLVTVGSEYTLAPIVTIAPPTTVGGTTATATATIYTNTTEVGMVPAVPGAAAFPAAWTTQTLGQPGDILDGRAGGVPDPRTIGPSMVQIGTEGGFLPTPVIWPNTPIGFERNPKNIVVGNVAEHNLLLGPAERADVIIDFSQFVGKTIILYNDGPAAVPAADSRLDYYTNDVDQVSTGGTTSTLAGYGPNTRTIMEFHVSAGTATPYNLTTLMSEFATTPTQQGVFLRDQDPILVPQAPYDSAYGTTSFPSDTTAYSRISNTSLTFSPLDLSTATKLSATTITEQFQPKCIQELFENDYGRMNATLGTELPFTNGTTQTTVPLGYVDPVTEVINDTPNASITPLGSAADGTQFWKITHNGVDTHFIHFHLFNVQVINRVGWDGMVKPPDANELGWKDTVRMNPLEDVIVAFRAVAPKLPFGIPDSIRPLDPVMPLGATWASIDPLTGNAVTVTNQNYNFGWEYVWHCHILSHEEMDMMRPMQFNVATTLPGAPVLSVPASATPIQLSWVDATPASSPATLGNPANEIGFRIERAQYAANGTTLGAYTAIGTALANATSFTDGVIAAPLTKYSYRIIAFNVTGETASNAISVTTPGGPLAPTGLAAALQAGPQVTLTWTDNATNETGYVIQRSVNGGAYASLATPAAHTGTGTMTYIDTTVLPGTTYAYQVYAVNGLIRSTLSNTATVVVPPAPLAPSGLAAVLQTGPQVTLTWTDNATNETGFVLQRSVNGGAFATLVSPAAHTGTGTMTYIDTTVTPGNAYAYQVRAMNGVIASAFSNTASVAVPALPLAPTGLAAVLQAGPQVTLTWTDNATNETGFVLQRSLNGGAFATIASPAASANTGTVTYIDTTALPGNTYAYQVRAMNGVIASAFSNTASVVVPPVPLAPTTLAAALQAGPQVTLTWTDRATNETGFVIQRSVNGGAYAPLATPAAHAGTGATTYIDTTVTAGNTYAYQVQAVNGVIASAFSNTANVVVPALPLAPTTLAAALQTGPQVTLTWTDNATNETGFVLQRSVNGGAFATLVSPAAHTGTGAMTYIDTTVTAGNTYAYQVQAVNGVITSAFSNTANVVVPALPLAPTTLAAVLQAGPQVALTWTDNATNETSYVVRRSVNGGAFAALATLAANAGTGTMTYTDTTTTLGNTYAYQVQAINGVIVSAFSNTASVTVAAAPAAPTTLTATLQAALGTAPKIALSFRDNATTETGFGVERSVNGGAFAAITTLPAKTGTGTVTYTDTAVAAGNSYAYRVRAVNGTIVSAYSNTPATVVIPAAPAAPSNFTATGTTLRRVDLKWTDNSNNETRFVIQRSTSPTFTTSTTFTVAANVTTFTQTGLVSGTIYYYRIMAQNLYGQSAWVNTVPLSVTVP